MELLRYGQSYKVQSRDKFNKIESTGHFPPMVRVNFLDFGRGLDRKSAFGVNLRWQDIESAIKAFSEMGHPDAVKLRNALDLANAVEEVGWKPSDETKSN
ncbi:hypothetical protein V5279_24980 [Bradyrhizobium sp. 26S5]|uniref:hypothetical protein n=1 Tax=Bradyrhizobium sp. 26S5 TaxID=3139729 RepID=UPI0030D2D8F7